MCEQQTIDVAYFTKELDALKASLPARTPEELGRYLMRLAAIVIPIENAQATEIAELKEELAFQVHRNEMNETELHEKIQLLKKANSAKEVQNSIEDIPAEFTTYALPQPKAETVGELIEILKQLPRELLLCSGLHETIQVTVFNVSNPDTIVVGIRGV